MICLKKKDNRSGAWQITVAISLNSLNLRIYRDDLERTDACPEKADSGNVNEIYQDPNSSLNSKMTIGALIGEPLLVHGVSNKTERWERVSELLIAVGLKAEL